MTTAEHIVDALQPILAEAIQWIAALASALLSRSRHPNMPFLRVLSQRLIDMAPFDGVLAKRRKIKDTRAAISARPPTFRSQMPCASTAAEHGPEIQLRVAAMLELRAAAKHKPAVAKLRAMPKHKFLSRLQECSSFEQSSSTPPTTLAEEIEPEVDADYDEEVPDWQ